MSKFLFHNDIKYRLARHLTFFAILVLVFTMVLFVRNHGHDFVAMLRITFINALIFLGYGYITIFFLLPVFLPGRKYVLLALSFLGLGILLSIIKLSVSGYIFYSSISPEFAQMDGVLTLRNLLMNTKDMSFIVALLVIARFTRDWLIVEKQHRSLLETYEELNLRLLQNHFEPHFLFNTLNNIYALSLRNIKKTEEMIRRFRNVLHFAITESQQSKVKMADELELINNYIAIEQIRYGTRLKVGFSFPDDCDDLEIAPFMLFTLVENCFRHGSSTDAGHPWIKILLTCKNERICFETQNSSPLKYPSVDHIQEKGMLRLRKRLDFFYPGKYLLELKEGPGIFETKLVVDLI